MTIFKALLPILLFVRSELAEKVGDPCSKFQGGWTPTGFHPLEKCPSEKTDDDYLECYDASQKIYWEGNVGFTSMYWCWSRKDPFPAASDPKNLTISAHGYDYDDNSEVNDIINRPFTARFYVNETHVICQENGWINIIDPINLWNNQVYCPTSTDYWAAHFYYDTMGQL